MAGDVPVPTSTLDGVLSHVPAAVPAKLLWAILEHIQKCLGSPLSHPGRAGQVGQQERKPSLPELRV